jgi:hypothetical protein
VARKTGRLPKLSILDLPDGIYGDRDCLLPIEHAAAGGKLAGAAVNWRR